MIFPILGQTKQTNHVTDEIYTFIASIKHIKPTNFSKTRR